MELPLVIKLSYILMIKTIKILDIHNTLFSRIIYIVMGVQESRDQQY
jgi:hypothetical protein